MIMMNRLIALALILGFLTSAILPALEYAFALQSVDTSTQLKPKAYGKKTSYAMCGENSCHKQFKILLTSNIQDSKKLTINQKLAGMR